MSAPDRPALSLPLRHGLELLGHGRSGVMMASAVLFLVCIYPVFMRLAARAPWWRYANAWA